MEIRNEIPEAKPTDPDLSDADATLEFVPRAHAPGLREKASSEPVITTMELTEADIVDVQAAVEALEKEEEECATVPVSTADVIAHVTQKVTLPPAVSPPKRIAAPKKKILSRQWMLVAAAIGTWTFFVSIASLAAFGVHAILRAHSDHADVASIAAPLASPQEAPKRARFIAEPVPPRAHAVDTSDDSQTADESASTDDSPMSSEASNRATSRFGILRFAHATNGALVDGEPRRVTGDALFLSCGAHRIRTSRAGSRTVRVPCGKTVTL